jgi:Tfp pilus assembly protein PilE
MEKFGTVNRLALICIAALIVILGVLSAVFIPKCADMAMQAKILACKTSLGVMRSAVAMEYARSASFGKAKFPKDITAALFADNSIPRNPLNNSKSVSAVKAAPMATAVSADGWWYIPASGRVGAYSDGKQDTSAW